MPSPYPSLRRSYDKTRLVFGIILLLINLHIFLRCSLFNLILSTTTPTVNPADIIPTRIPWNPSRQQSDLRISKATISYASKEPSDAHNLLLHARHTEKFRYPTHTLRTPIIWGAANKLLYLQSLIITELQKPVEEQVDWIFYYDSTLILANPEIPLHRFLPPVTDVETFKTLCIIDAQSERGQINTAVFFLRVSGSSLRVLTEALETIYNAPRDARHEAAEDNVHIDSAALQNVLYRAHHRDKSIFQPREWYNSTASLFYQPYHRTPAHRLLPISETLAVDEVESQVFPDEESVQRFWHAVSEARRVLDDAKEKGQTSEQGAWWEMVQEVEEWVEMRAWDTVELERRVGVLREAVGGD